MRFLVCVKQVPDTTEVRIDSRTGTLIREGIPTILNPFCQVALEECLRVRKMVGGQVTVISLGPPDTRSSLLKCLALGADRAVLLTDTAFAGSDTYATSYALSLAAKKVGFDLVFCGQQALDGDTGQVGPELAHHLGIPQATYVESVEKVEGGRLTVRCQTDEGYQILQLSIPALLALTPSSSFQPKSPPLSGIMKARRKPFVRWGAADLEGQEGRWGLEASPTRVIRVYPPPPRGKGVILTGDPREMANRLADELLGKGVLDGATERA